MWKGSLNVGSAWFHLYSRYICPGSVVLLDPRGIPCKYWSLSLVQITGSIFFILAYLPSPSCSFGLLCPDHTQASPLVLLWRQSLYVIQGGGLLCLSPIFLPCIPWQSCQCSHSVTGLARVWRSLALVCLFCGNSYLFLIICHPAKMPVDLAFFLLFRCWNFQ